MKPEFILQADVLDILFENRNKEYGAYELRRQYDHRLKKSLGLVFLALFSVYGFIYIKNHFFSGPTNYIIREVPIPGVELTKINNKPEIIPKEKPRPERRIAQTIYTRPVITRQQITHPTPTQEELADKLISTKNMDGDKSQGNDILPVNTNGTGPSTEKKQEPEASPAILDIAEIMPEYPGGIPALQRFLSRNLKTPKDDMEAGAKVRVLVRFVVDKDGSITGIDIEQSGGADFDNEVTRVMKKMPAWKPGRQNGRNVSVYFKIPVVFQAGDDN